MEREKKINKKLIGLIVFVLALSLGGLFISQRNDTTQQEKETASKVDTHEEQQQEEQKLIGNVCEYTLDKPDENTKITTIIYTDGENKRTNGRAVVNNTEVYNRGLIYDTERIYKWSNTDKVGESNVRKESDSLNIPFDDKRYTCSDWEVDESFFVPPPDITFTELDE